MIERDLYKVFYKKGNSPEKYSQMVVVDSFRNDGLAMTSDEVCRQVGESDPQGEMYCISAQYMGHVLDTHQRLGYHSIPFPRKEIYDRMLQISSSLISGMASLSEKLDMENPRDKHLKERFFKIYNEMNSLCTDVGLQESWGK